MRTVDRDSAAQAVVDMYIKHRALVVHYATGFGKTKAALNAVDTDGPFNPVKYHAQGLIVCHTETSRDDTWPNEIIKWWGKDKLWPVQLTCYQSLKQYAGKRYQWLILDEAHYITIAYDAALNNIQYDGIILLTALPPDDPIKIYMINRLSKGHSLTISLDTAIANKVLNDYKIRVWGVHLSPVELFEYRVLTKRIQDNIMRGNTFMVKKYGGERMRFLYNSHTKLNAGKYLVNEIRKAKRRFGIFAGSKAVIEQLTPYVMHSGVDDTDYQRFRRGEIDEIGSIKQIQEGANIHGLQTIFIQQLNSKQLKLAQTIGRGMRLGIDEVLYVHILVAKGTKDEEWANMALKGFDQKKITRHMLDNAIIDAFINQINNNVQ
jgi:superfamily II DNA or RNA helicase